MLLLFAMLCVSLGLVAPRGRCVLRRARASKMVGNVRRQEEASWDESDEETDAWSRRVSRVAVVDAPTFLVGLQLTRPRSRGEDRVDSAFSPRVARAAFLGLSR